MKLNLTGVIGAVAVGSTLLLAEVRAQEEEDSDPCAPCSEAYACFNDEGVFQSICPAEACPCAPCFGASADQCADDYTPPTVIDHTTFPPGDYSCFCGLGGTFNPDMVPDDMSTVFMNIESNDQRTCAEAASGTMISRMVPLQYDQSDEWDDAVDAHSIALEEAWTGWEIQTCEARVEQVAATAYCAGNSLSSMEVCSQFTSEDACSGHGQFPASEDDLMQNDDGTTRNTCVFHDAATMDWTDTSYCSCDAQCGMDDCANGLAQDACETQTFVQLSSCGWDDPVRLGQVEALVSQCCTIDYALKYAFVCEGALGGTTFDPNANAEGQSCEEKVGWHWESQAMMKKSLSGYCCTGGDGPNLDCFCDAGETFDMSGEEKQLSDHRSGSCTKLVVPDGDWSPPLFDGESCESSLTKLNADRISGDLSAPMDVADSLGSIKSYCCGAPLEEQVESLAEDYSACFCPSGIGSGTSDEFNHHGMEGSCNQHAAMTVRRQVFSLGTDPFKDIGTCADDLANIQPKCLRNDGSEESCAAAASEQDCDNARYANTKTCSYKGTECQMGDWGEGPQCYGHENAPNNAPGFQPCPVTQDEEECNAARWSTAEQICHGEFHEEDDDDGTIGKSPMDGGACAAVVPTGWDDCNDISYEVEEECQWSKLELDDDWEDNCCAMDPLAGIGMCDGVDGADLDGYDGARRLPIHDNTCGSMWQTIQEHLDGDIAQLTAHTTAEFGNGAPYTTSGDDVLSICCGLACQDYDGGLAWTVATVDEEDKEDNFPLFSAESCADMSSFDFPTDYLAALELTNPVNLCTVYQDSKDAAFFKGEDGASAAEGVLGWEKHANVACPLTCNGDPEASYCALPTAEPTPEPTTLPTSPDVEDVVVEDAVVEDVVVEIEMVLTFEEELSDDDQTDACAALVTGIADVDASVNEDYITCDMSLQSRRSRHLLSFVYDTDMTITIPASVVAAAGGVATVAVLQATIADPVALEASVTASVAEIGGGAEVSGIETEVSGVDDDVDVDNSSSLNGASLFVVFGAMLVARF